MIGVGVWLEIQESTIVDAIESNTFLAGPYLIIAAGCAVVVVAVIGMCGALCDMKCNRFLLGFVSSDAPSYGCVRNRGDLCTVANLCIVDSLWSLYKGRSLYSGQPCAVHSLIFRVVAFLCSDEPLNKGHTGLEA